MDNIFVSTYTKLVNRVQITWFRWRDAKKAYAVGVLTSDELIAARRDCDEAEDALAAWEAENLRKSA